MEVLGSAIGRARLFASALFRFLLFGLLFDINGMDAERYVGVGCTKPGSRLPDPEKGGFRPLAKAGAYLTRM